MRATSRRSLLLLVPLALGAQAPAPPTPAEEEREPPRWEGTASEGVAEMARRVELGEEARALEIGEALLAPTAFLRWRRDAREWSGGWSEWPLAPIDPLLEDLGWNGPPEPVQAEVHYALGLAHRAAADPAAAREALGRSAALAGPGELRLDALYNGGALTLELAEVMRLRIPEVAEAEGLSPAAGAAPPSPPGGGAPGAAPEEPDPLDVATALYLAARDELALRLRADWRDRATRVNLEWIGRRLDELEEIRRQREQQQQDQQQDEQDQQDQEQQDQEQQDQQDPDEQQETEPSGSEPPQEGDEQQEERLLTREEVMRLLDLLEEIEKEGEALRARLQQQRRVPVERDW